MALLPLLAWTTTAVGQVDVTFTGSCCSTYESTWDGKLLTLEAVEGCSGYAEYRIEVTEPVVVTYNVSLLCGEGNPSVDPPFGAFNNIRRLCCAELSCKLGGIFHGQSRYLLLLVPWLRWTVLL